MPDVPVWSGLDDPLFALGPERPRIGSAERPHRPGADSQPRELVGIGPGPPSPAAEAAAQVTVEYEGTRAIRVETVVVSTQHAEAIQHAALKEAIIEEVIRPVIPASLLTHDTKFHINPTGRFVIGGPQGDTGLTGRKIIVDTYGGSAPHGGGAFSGKDPTKVDRSAAYMARYVAKNLVAAGMAERALIQLAYAIGVADPVSVHVETFGTGRVPRTGWSRSSASTST